MKKEEMFGHIAELYEVIEYFGREKCETEEENKKLKEENEKLKEQLKQREHLDSDDDDDGDD